jgi:amino acid transporter
VTTTLEPRGVRARGVAETARLRPVSRPRRDGYNIVVIVSMVIAGVLAMLGAASFVAGLSGVFGLERLGFIRTVSFLGLGLVGAGAGGLLLIILDGLRTANSGRPRP